ncbi:hypothetical protein SUGI_0212670 [Cryptomeria japonica]|nr:hypothetical protein SUGI_0212670 [Cryptomeria japonica]
MGSGSRFVAARASSFLTTLYEGRLHILQCNKIFWLVENPKGIKDEDNNNGWNLGHSRIQSHRTSKLEYSVEECSLPSGADLNILGGKRQDVCLGFVELKRY